MHSLDMIWTLEPRNHLFIYTVPHWVLIAFVSAWSADRCLPTHYDLKATLLTTSLLWTGQTRLLVKGRDCGVLHGMPCAESAWHAGFKAWSRLSDWFQQKGEIEG